MNSLTFYASRFTLVHVAPLGLEIFAYAMFYKHVAPLGLEISVR